MINVEWCRLHKNNFHQKYPFCLSTIDMYNLVVTMNIVYSILNGIKLKKINK